MLLNGHAVRIHRQRYGRAFGELQARWQESERWEPAQLGQVRALDNRGGDALDGERSGTISGMVR